MKTLKSALAIATATVVLVSVMTAQAGLTLTDFSTSDGITYTGSGSGSQVIPDNTSAGAGYSINFAAGGLSISDISITLNLSGGYNGDIYAYLSHGSQIAVLLNQITGSPNSSGFNITLIEGTGNPIQTATGTAGSPLSDINYTANQDLSVFNNTDPNGAWTLFFADQSPGDTSTLNSFNVTITAVPEPVNVALGIFGGLMGLLALARSQMVRAKLKF